MDNSGATLTAARGSARGTWYRQPIVWLGASIFAASLAGCIVMAVLGARHPDDNIAVDSPTVLKVPLERPAEEQRAGTTP